MLAEAATIIAIHFLLLFHQVVGEMLQQRRLLLQAFGILLQGVIFFFCLLALAITLIIPKVGPALPLLSKTPRPFLLV